MNKLINRLVSIVLIIAISCVTGCNKEYEVSGLNKPATNETGNTNKEDDNTNSMASVEKSITGVWVLDDDKISLSEFITINVHANYDMIVFCDDGLGYMANETNLVQYVRKGEQSGAIYTLIHWNVNKSGTEYELQVDYQPNKPTQSFYIIDITDDELTIENYEGKCASFKKAKNYISKIDYSVQSIVMPGCWYHSSGINNGVFVKDKWGYVFCKDGTGYYFTASNPEVKKWEFTWKLVWGTRHAYFNDFTINSNPVMQSFYLDIAATLTYKYLINGLNDMMMLAYQYGSNLNIYESLIRDFSYTAPSTATEDIIKNENTGNNGNNQGTDEKEDDKKDEKEDDKQEENSESKDIELTNKLIGKWVNTKSLTSTYSSYYVFLDDGTGYWESFDTYSEARERNWLHWSVKEGNLEMAIDGIGERKYAIQFDGTKLKLINNSSEIIYTHASVYNVYKYGTPPYDGYYIYDKYTGYYYPIYTVEESKSYASEGEGTFNHLYLWFRGKDNGKNTRAIIHYATPSWDGLPAGWKEGRYYISDTNGAYKYDAGFKIDGRTVSSTNSDYLEIKKEGNNYSYRYYGKNVFIDFTGTVK